MHLHKVLSEDAQEVRLYCFSEERAAKERGIVERFAKRFEDALTKLSEGLSKPRTQKHLDKVWQRIGRLKAQSRGVAQHYDVELDTDETGERATAVRFIRRPVSGSMMTHPGVVLPAQQSNRLGRSHPVAHLLHPHRPRGGVPLTEIRTRSTPDLSPQADSRRRASVHHRDRVSNSCR